MALHTVAVQDGGDVAAVGGMCGGGLRGRRPRLHLASSTESAHTCGNGSQHDGQGCETALHPLGPTQKSAPGRSNAARVRKGSAVFMMAAGRRVAFYPF